MAVSNYSGYNPVTGTVTWDGGGYSTAVGNYTISGPMSPPSTGTPIAAPAAPTPTQQPQAGPSAEDLYWQQRAAAERDARLAAERQQRETASAFLKNVLTTYGLGSLTGSIDSLIQQWGTNTEVIALKLKDTNEYKTRFKGLLGLQQKGITDVRNESEYLALESSYRQVFRDSNMSWFLGEGGTQAEYDKIADLVSNYSVSVDEVRNRVQDAQRLAYQASPEAKEALARYYGVSGNDIVAYFLDPAGTTERVNQMANAAMVGGAAAQSGFRNVSSSVAESIAGFAGDQDINAAQLGTDMVGARQVMDATNRLAFIENTTLTDDELLQSQFDLNADAKKKVSGLQSRERARFSGQSAFGTGSLTRQTGA